MTAAEFFTPDRLARLPSIRLNSGEVCRDLPRYVAAQLARAKGKGRAASTAAWHLEKLMGILNEKEL